MSRLFAFGCSHTYGEGQVDCLNYHNEYGETKANNPSQYAWPALLGKILGIEVVNVGFPGASNRYIANQILNTDISKKDIVVILWTEFDRSTVFLKDLETTKHIRPTDFSKTSNYYYKWVHNPYNSFLESLEAINLANYNLQEHPHVFNFIVGMRTEENSIFTDYKYPTWHKVDLINQSLHYVDKAADGDHPGIESQKLIARDILKRIKFTN